MKSSTAPLTLLLALAASAASAQEFAGMDEFRGQLSGIRAVAQQQALIPQAPPIGSMGASERAKVKSDSLVEAEGTPNVSAYQVRGIDISHFQHAIDWSKVKVDGLSFVYVKATEGADGLDDEFATNWAGIKSRGLERGAYHFYNFCKKGPEQAANFIKTVPADADALPPTIDLEESVNCKKMPAKAAFRKELEAFVAAVQTAYGHAPILYVNASIYEMYFQGENDSYRLWIADVNHEAPAIANVSWTMWQYAWHGTVAGITGDVDFDAFNGTKQMLASLPDSRSIMVASLGPR